MTGEEFGEPRSQDIGRTGCAYCVNLIPETYNRKWYLESDGEPGAEVPRGLVWT